MSSINIDSGNSCGASLSNCFRLSETNHRIWLQAAIPAAYSVHRLTYLFISHDLGVVRYVCDEVAVIWHGNLVEQGQVDSIFNQPQNDYTRMLLEAMPDPDPDRSPFKHITSQKDWGLGSQPYAGKM